jgi:hypothetical protein
MARRRKVGKLTGAQKRKARQSLMELQKAHKKLLLQIAKHSKNLRAMRVFSA